MGYYALECALIHSPTRVHSSENGAPDNLTLTTADALTRPRASRVYMATASD